MYVQVLIGISLGVLLGYVSPSIGVTMKPLGDAFIKLIKMVIAPVTQAAWQEAQSLDETTRGSGGFGSTGVAARES